MPIVRPYLGVPRAAGPLVLGMVLVVSLVASNTGPLRAADADAVDPAALRQTSVAPDAQLQYGGWRGISQITESQARDDGFSHMRFKRTADYSDLLFQRYVHPDSKLPTQPFRALSGSYHKTYDFRTGGKNTRACVTAGEQDGRVEFEQVPLDRGINAESTRAVLNTTLRDGRLVYWADGFDIGTVRVRKDCEYYNYGERRVSHQLGPGWVISLGGRDLRDLTDPMRIRGTSSRSDGELATGRRSFDASWDLSPTSVLAADILALPEEEPGSLVVGLRIANRGATTVTDLRAPETLLTDGAAVAHQTQGPAVRQADSLAPGATVVFVYRFRVTNPGLLTFRGEAEVRDPIADITFPVFAEGGVSLIVNDDGDEPNGDAAAACDVDPDTAGEQCTLRAAIEFANALPGRDTIVFDPLVNEVEPRSPLPEISGPVLITGALDGGGRVELDGGRAGEADGLVLTGGGSVIDSMIIHGFEGSGIVISGEGGSQVTGSLIGLDRDMKCPEFDSDAGVCRGNGAHGIHIQTSEGNIIGGVRPDVECAGPCNVISGNAQDGIHIVGGGGPLPQVPTTGDGNRVLGNMIGVDADGRCGDGSPTAGCLIGNGYNGVYVETASETVVGTGDLIEACLGGCNVISANRLHGVVVTGRAQTAMGTNVSGNLIGLAVDGSCDILGDGGCREGNRGTGVVIAGGMAGKGRDTDTVVGGTAPGAGNVISGNGGPGVYVVGYPNGDVRVEGNRIGTSPAGTIAIPNLVGVRVWRGPISVGELSVSGTPVGGIGIGGTRPADECAQACNLISGNRGSGIMLAEDKQYDTCPDGCGPLVEPGATEDPTQGVRPPTSIEGNLIGTDILGRAAIPNGGSGIEATQAGAVWVAKDQASSPNVISGNAKSGITFTGFTFGFINHNFIGTDIGGTKAVPNEGNGVTIAGAEVDVGADDVDTCTPICNVISGNKVHGIEFTKVTKGLYGRIRGNLIGLTIDGDAPLANGKSGILLLQSDGIEIGAADDGNVISANGAIGLAIAQSVRIQVQGNRIGTRPDGSCPRDARDRCPLGNRDVAVYLLQSAAVDVGGTDVGEGNVISGNAPDRCLPSLQIRGPASQGNVIAGNIIGLDAAGRKPVPNAGGIWLSHGATRNVVGGGSDRAANVISSNGVRCVLPGVGISHPGTTGNQVAGNLIGTTADGKEARGNGGHGVIVWHGAAENVIGGESAEEQNVIAHNGAAWDGADGVRILPSAGDGNLVSGNRIHDNAGLGIDLGSEGVTPNDTLDTDAPGHGNGIQNVPVLLRADRDLVVGILDSLPGTTFTIRLFAVASCDTGEFGHGEGDRYGRELAVTTDSTGHGEFRAAAPRRARVVTATATHEGSTSEFSRCLAVGERFDPTDSDGDGIEDALEDAARNKGDGNDDGVQDREQANVASFLDPIQGRRVALVAPDGTRLTRVTPIDHPASTGSPAGVTFGHGFVQYGLQDLEPGGSVAMVLILPDEAERPQVWRYMLAADEAPVPDDGQLGLPGDAPSVEGMPGLSGSPGTWRQADADVVGRTVTFTVTDGGGEDGDLARDGRITDLVGVGSAVAD